MTHRLAASASASTPATKESGLHVLAFDPGKNDFAFCFLVNNKIKRVGMFMHTMKDMREQYFMFEVRGFIRESERFMKSLGKLDYIVIERYMSRPGKGGGSVSESINVMIGLLARYCHKHGICIVPITSALWKNRFRRSFGYDTQAERYGFPVSKTSNTEPILDHEFDAIGIGQWFCECRSIGGKTKSIDMMPGFRHMVKALWKQRLEHPTNGKPRMPGRSIAGKDSVKVTKPASQRNQQQQSPKKKTRAHGKAEATKSKAAKAASNSAKTKRSRVSKKQ